MDGMVHVYHLYIIRHSAKMEILRALEERRIGCGSYYPVPLHLQGAYKDHYSDMVLPIVEKASKETFALPLFPEMTYKQQAYVLTQLITVLKNIDP